MGQVELPSPHWEALTPETQRSLRKIAGLGFIQDFYLAGGTGLALHLGHRFSVDLDFFSSQADAVGADQRAILREEFEDPTLTITFDKDATFVANWQGVGLSFFSVGAKATYNLVTSFTNSRVHPPFPNALPTP
jgi:hypothetical protein